MSRTDEAEDGGTMTEQNWDKVAAIVAIVTLACYVLPLLLRPLIQGLHQLLWHRLFYRGRRCDAVAWEDLHDRRLHAIPTLQTILSATSERGLTAPHTSQTSGLTAFFERVWRVRARPVARPDYLDASKSYLRVDADALIAAILVDGSAGLGGSGTLPVGRSFAFRYGDVTGRFHCFREDGIGGDPYVIGRLAGFPTHDVVRPTLRGITKDDLRAIADGYPPFYRRTFTSHSGVEVLHPIRAKRDVHRGAWLTAIGFAAHEPLSLYNSGFMGAYREACDRVLHTIRRFRAEYDEHPIFRDVLDVAVRAVVRMNGHSSGSGLPSIIQGTALQECSDGQNIGSMLSAPELIFAMRLFKDFDDGPLSAEDRARAEPIFLEAVKAAVNGIYIWWQYVNNASSELPGWMRDERIRQCPIWIEDSDPII